MGVCVNYMNCVVCSFKIQGTIPRLFEGKTEVCHNVMEYFAAAKPSPAP